MAYKIIVSPRAQLEIENAIDYYSLYSVKAPLKFIISLEDTYSQLKENPYFAIRYNNIRSLNIHKFPHTLFFKVKEGKKLVRVLSCFHNKRNPKRRPKN